MELLQCVLPETTLRPILWVFSNGVCTASDTAGNSASCAFNYVVQDNTSPVLNLPPSQTLPATCCAGADASYCVTASDSCELVSLTCSINGASVPVEVSNIKFPVGVTTITCVALNGANLSTTGSFTITVTDQPPCIQSPASITVECASNGHSSVSYSVSASDVQQGDISSSVTCNYPSGSLFGLGTTQIDCSVTDCLGLSTSCGFSITVHDTTRPLLTVRVTRQWGAPHRSASQRQQVTLARRRRKSLSFAILPTFLPTLPIPLRLAALPPTMWV